MINGSPKNMLKNSLGNWEVQVCLLFISLFYVFNLFQSWNNWAVDFSAYYYAGYFYGLGQFDQIYAGPPDIIGRDMPEAWTAAVAETGTPGRQTYPYIYLPWVAALLSPIARHFSAQSVMNAALLLNCALLVWSVFLARKIMAPKAIPLWVWVGISLALLMTSATSVTALSLGQVQILVFTCCLLAFERYRAGAFYAAGAVLAFAACLKITPAAFAIVFLWDRNWRAILAFAAICAVVGVLSFLWIGLPLHFEYLDLIGKLSKQVLISSIGLTLEGFVFQIWDLVNGTAPIHVSTQYIYPKPVWIDHITKAAFITGLIAIWMSTRRLAKDQKLGRQILTLSILIPLTGPIGWVHYFLLTTLLLPGLLDLMNRKLAIMMISLFGLLLSAESMMALIRPDLRIMPQIILCVPVLTLLLVTILIFGYRGVDASKASDLEILPAE